MKIKFSYDIVYNEYRKVYVVYKNNEEHFIAVGIFESPSRKECREYIKSLKTK